MAVAFINPKARQVAEGYGEWLSKYQWDYFVTLTFREQRKAEAAARAARYLYKTLKCDRGFVAAEPFRIAGTHTHSLLHIPDQIKKPTTDEVWALCKRKFGRADVVTPGVGASYYCSKYAGVDSYHPPDILGDTDAWALVP